MKKSYLWTGFAMVFAGVLCLLAALLLDTRLDSILCGFFGAFTVPGILQIYKYFKWGRSPEYRAKLEEEQINLQDERKEMLRNKAGRCAYILGMMIAAVSILVFSFLQQLGGIEEAEGRLMTLFLAAYLLVQYFAGVVIYHVLDRTF